MPPRWQENDIALFILDLPPLWYPTPTHFKLIYTELIDSTSQPPSELAKPLQSRAQRSTAFSPAELLGQNKHWKKHSKHSALPPASLLTCLHNETRKTKALVQAGQEMRTQLLNQWQFWSVLSIQLSLLLLRPRLLMPPHLGTAAPPLLNLSSFQLGSHTGCQVLQASPAVFSCKLSAHTLATSQTQAKVPCRGTEKLAEAGIRLQGWKLRSTWFMMEAGTCPKHKALDKLAYSFPSSFLKSR